MLTMNLHSSNSTSKIISGVSLYVSYHRYRCPNSFSCLPHIIYAFIYSYRMCYSTSNTLLTIHPCFISILSKLDIRFPVILVDSHYATDFPSPYPQAFNPPHTRPRVYGWCGTINARYSYGGWRGARNY